MKLGVICEGDKTDGPVLDALLRAEFPTIRLEIVPTSKAVIFSQIGAIADRLLSSGCERVVIAWDLHPVGTQMSVSSQAHHTEPCQWDQRRTLLEVAGRTSENCQADIELLQRRYGFHEGNGAGGNLRVCLVCFCESFDAIFLTDGPLLRDLASSAIRRAEAPPAVRTPISAKRPQEVIRRYFRRGHNSRFKYFNKYEHNIHLARAFTENGRLNRLRRHRGYDRLVTVVAGWLAELESGSRASRHR